ncbi:MAG: WecB/TagA/CpsF family glycosyltransferase [Alteromonadaceae bacterium]|nr:WecB/TagA/CpsF family glycosyltransferase [Alteromonadaceae bacterium]
MQVHVTNLHEAVNKVLMLSEKKEPSYVCVSNVHMCMETFDSPEFRQIVNNAGLVIADGRPIYWAQKLLGHKQAKQVRGQDIMNALCERSNDLELRIGLYGGNTDLVLNKVVSTLKQQFPNIKITYQYSPPFRLLTEGENKQVIADIHKAELDILFVGIGCPKQERWMAENYCKLQCVMVGVGAAFDFLAGDKKHAPKWMQKMGFEWLFRLISEPKRLWTRYLKQNPRFIFYFIQQLLNK